MLTLVGNKSDLSNSRRVSNEDVEVLARRHNAKSIIVSAKNGDNIKTLFADLAERLVKKNTKV